MADDRLEALLARLERERVEADRLYNAALTALDQSLQRVPEMPHPPPPYDEQQINPINLAWNILPDGPPAFDRSLKGRMRAFVWRLVGPALETQKGFNAALVDHLNRNIAAHREAQKAIATLIEVVQHQIDGTVIFQSQLIRYLQTITLYVDTKDRTTAGGAQVLNAAVGALTDDWLKRWESLTAREQRYQARSATLTKAYEDVKEVASLAQQTSMALKRDVQRVLTRQPPAAGAELPSGAPASEAPPRPSGLDLDSVVYVGFEDRFRGSRDEIRARLADYLPLFAGRGDVLDVGCGRGELLDLFREHGIPARGIDVNAEMVEVCRERGLEAARADAVGYLATVPDESLGGVIAIQVVEHLDPAYLVRWLDLLHQKLRAGAPVVLETINVTCWVAFFESYLRDLSHVRPLHPDTLRYLVQASGFVSAEVQYRAPVPDADKLPRAAVRASSSDSDPDPQQLEIINAINAHADTLNARLFTFMDYAVVARR